MKIKLYVTLVCLLAVTISVSAKTYKLKSGKWTDPGVWGNDYPGTTVRATDIVIVEGAILMNESIVIEGTLWVEKGASVVGLRNLTVAGSGNLINYGNTVVERIINEGHIVNNLSLEAIIDIDNKGSIENVSNLVAGNNFNNTTGYVSGEKSTFFAQNDLITSPDSKFGPGVRLFYGNTVEQRNDSVSTTQNASINNPRSQAEVSKILQVANSSSSK